MVGRVVVVGCGVGRVVVVVGVGGGDSVLHSAKGLLADTVLPSPILCLSLTD